MSLLVPHLIAEAFHHYVRKQVIRPQISPLQFHKECAKLCSCENVDDMYNIVSSLLSQLTYPTKSVSVFVCAKSNHLKHVETDVNYSLDLLPLSIRQSGNWKIIVLKSSDELVKSSFFQMNDQVLVFPLLLANHSLSSVIFVSGAIEQLQDFGLLEILHHHATSCYGRLYKQLLKNSEDDSYITTMFRLCGINFFNYYRRCKIMYIAAKLGEDNAYEMQANVSAHIAEVTSSEKCCLLLAAWDIGHFICQVVGSKQLDFEYYYPLKGGFFGNICRSHQPKIMQQFSQNEQDILRSLFKVHVKSFMCVPIFSNSSKEVVALVCACNKADGQRYTMSDISSSQTCLRYTWTLLTSSLALQKERKLKDECQAMLQIARNLFTHLDDVTILLGEIIQEARTLTDAERCSVFLVDKESQELVAKVFDGIITVDESLDPRQYDFEGMNEVRLPLSQGIAGHVATTGQTLNIIDAYSHPLFYRGIDESTGFKTRNILCFPIKDSNGIVVGVSQLCNKIKGQSFTQYDVELAERLSVFSGISISHSLLYKQVIEAQCRSQLTNELMTYHMKVNKEEVEHCLSRLPSSLTDLHPQFDCFIYPPRSLPDDLKCIASVQMYNDLGLTSMFHLSTRTLIRFVLKVKQGYRDPPYHNWDHAFSVAHHAYLLAKNIDLCNVFGELEVLALLTASFCHDLDHRGTNNAFQVSSKSTLAALYSSEGSVLERHHFAQAMCILNSGSCNIFENMSKTDYVRVIDLVKDIILATDVAHHLRILPKLEEIEKSGTKPASFTAEQKTLLLDLCMTACDLSDQTKDWMNTKNTAKLVYKEFFYQGDIEKSMGNRPAVINDRERACVPELQINFMEHIAGPVYRIMASVFPACFEVNENFESNIARWKLVEKKFKSLQLPNTNSLDFLTEEFDRELFATNEAV